MVFLSFSWKPVFLNKHSILRRKDTFLINIKQNKQTKTKQKQKTTISSKFYLNNTLFNFQTVYLEIISNLQKRYKNKDSTKNTPVPFLQMHLFFPRYPISISALFFWAIWGKAAYIMVLLHQILQCVLPMNRNILLANHNTIISLSTFNIDIILLSVLAPGFQSFG